MRIALIEPYFGGSHRHWCEGIKEHLPIDVDLFTLPARHWKWHMHGGSIALAREASDLYVKSRQKPDLFVLSSMTDLGTFSAHLSATLRQVPSVYYFHENQLTYPWSSIDPDQSLGRDIHYAFVHFSSALAADEVWFNSHRHRIQFLKALVEFLAKLPDNNHPFFVDEIEAKSKVMHLGLGLKALRADAGNNREQNTKPLLLWNHRWEFDKNPDTFFEALENLSLQGFDFDLAVLGEHFRKIPPCFTRAQDVLKKHIVQFGYCHSRKDYARWLGKADILPVTSLHDFFGISVVEAIACGVRPLLPFGLAYEEHVDDKQYFYDRDHFEEALKEALTQWQPGWSYPHADQMLRYDWETIAPRYHKAFLSFKR